MITKPGPITYRTTASPPRQNIAADEMPGRERKLNVTAPVVAVAMILVGAIEGYASGEWFYAKALWELGLIGAGFPVVFRTVRGILRGHFAADVVASLSIVTAAIIGQPFAGLIIVLMQTGGEALEKFAERRASAAVSELEKRAPRIAHLFDPTRGLIDVPVDRIEPGDNFLVRPGELIPCDGTVVGGISEIDVSQLTGEAIPVAAVAGAPVMSGSLNAHGVISIKATARAAESQYSRIVDLVRSAQASKAPLQRLADRYAVWFTPLTLFLCGLAYAFTGSWLIVLAVLVVATPCPLILATPVAIIGGINRAARRKIIMRHGAALEYLSDASIAVFDKTGTLTIGKPSVRNVHALPGFSERTVLTYAGAVEQGSSHLLARVVVDEAERRFGPLPEASQHRESPGQGLVGLVSNTDVVVGSRAFVATKATVSLDDFVSLERSEAGLKAYVLLDGKPAGIIEYEDALRAELPELLTSLQKFGISRRVLLSGDRTENARAVGRLAGMDQIYGELLPADKAALVSRYRAAGDVVMMVGDGTNDAPALTAADVGIALAGHGGGVTSEAADIVILVDDLGKVGEALAISRRTMRIARQSIAAGLLFSAIAMLFAAFGYIPPTAGALLQEAIDVAVILNALRASWGTAHDARSTGTGRNNV
ncbi:MAG TPA: heavy metal translocating P-type ATPase [Gemmatimonadaceae bacterium]|nr:heavy metal translocating P-type ATPase [Gemmatimonadaceae bacterium]